MRKYYLSVILLTAFAVTAWGQVGQRSQLGSLQRYLFSPDLVMRNQEALTLTDEQRSQLVEEIKQAQTAFTELNWNLQKEVQTLTSMFDEPAVEESAILDQFDAVLDLERQVKRTHLVLALRMRNILDAEQLEKIEELRRKRGRNALRERWSSLRNQRK